jgi:poly(A) polymerase
MKLDPARHAWMSAPETKAVMAALGEARFVGGAVRNALLAAPVADIDIAVPLRPEQAQARLMAAGIKVIPTGIDHGTVTAVLGNHVFEVTSLRRDVETDGRHAVIAYTPDWSEDAFRRDFTINALYAAPDGEIFDYATGVEDLIAGKVRFMGDAATRIAEDYLRILRLFRFHAWYGKGEIDPEGLHAAAAARDQLKKLSAERIAKELLRLVEAPVPGPVLRVMAASGILAELLPGALNVPRLEKQAEIERDNFFKADPLLRLAALLPDEPAIAAETAERLRLSNAARARLITALSDAGNTGSDRIVSYLSVREVRKLLYRIGAPAFRDRVMLRWAGSPKGAAAIQWRMLLAMAEAWERPRFPLTGREVMLAGVPEGPQVGRILAEVEDWWIDCDFVADEFALSERLKAIVQAEL